MNTLTLYYEPCKHDGYSYSIEGHRGSWWIEDLHDDLLVELEFVAELDDAVREALEEHRFFMCVIEECGWAFNEAPPQDWPYPGEMEFSYGVITIYPVREYHKYRWLVVSDDMNRVAKFDVSTKSWLPHKQVSDERLTSLWRRYWKWSRRVGKISLYPWGWSYRGGGS